MFLFTGTDWRTRLPGFSGWWMCFFFLLFYIFFSPLLKKKIFSSFHDFRLLVLFPTSSLLSQINILTRLKWVRSSSSELFFFFFFSPFTYSMPWPMGPGGNTNFSHPSFYVFCLSFYPNAQRFSILAAMVI